MARATTTKTPTRKSRSLAIDDAHKRKPGRPVGSTNARKPASTTAAKTARPSAKRVTAPKAAAAARAPKLNKAELEAQVSKLERTIVRLRDKNKELKQAVSEAREHQDSLEAELAAKPAPKPVAETPKPPRKSRTSAAKVAAEPVPEPANDETTDA